MDGPLTAAGLGAFLPVPDKAMTALRRLLGSNGVGASGFVFFAGPDQGAQRVLGAVKSALDLAASPAFAPAFGGSTSLADYRWGKLHRITFAHPLGPAFSLPPRAGSPISGPGCPASPRTAASRSSTPPRTTARVRAQRLPLRSGPARRFVAETLRSHPHAVQVTPGGARREPVRPVLREPAAARLTNEYHPATVQVGDRARRARPRGVPPSG